MHAEKAIQVRAKIRQETLRFAKLHGPKSRNSAAWDQFVQQLPTGMFTSFGYVVRWVTSIEYKGELGASSPNARVVALLDPQNQLVLITGRTHVERREQIAHELAHYLLGDAQGDHILHREVRGRGNGYAVTGDLKERWAEDAVDEILMPEGRVGDVFKHRWSHPFLLERNDPVVLRVLAGDPYLGAIPFLRLRQRDIALAFARCRWNDAPSLADIFVVTPGRMAKRLRQLGLLGPSSFEDQVQRSRPVVSAANLHPRATNWGFGEPVHATIVELDLSRYSDIARNLEQNLSPTEVAKLNDQIEGLVNSALRAVGADPEEVCLANTGDGAILAFDSSNVASHFAEKLLQTSHAHNRGKTVHLAQRHFRIGISSGKIALTRIHTASGDFKRFKMAGIAIAEAVRLEAAAKTGEVVIFFDTWADLPRDERSWYGAEETIKGKRNEILRVHRRKVIEPAPWET